MLVHKIYLIPFIKTYGIFYKFRDNAWPKEWDINRSKGVFGVSLLVFIIIFAVITIIKIAFNIEIMINPEFSAVFSLIIFIVSYRCLVVKSSFDRYFDSNMIYKGNSVSANLITILAWIVPIFISVTYYK